MTEVSNLLDRLIACGLAEKDARVLLTLAGQPPMKASDVGRTIGLSRMDAYNTLRRLQDSDLVRATIDKPMRFSSGTIESTIETLVRQQEAELGRLRSHLDEMRSGEATPSLSSLESEHGEATFTVIKGRNAIHSTITRLVEDSESEVWCLLGRHGVLPLMRRGDHDVLNAAALRGVRVRILASIDRRTLSTFDRFDESIEIRHSEQGSGQALLVDDEIAVQTVVHDSNPHGRGRDEAALLIEAGGYIQAQTELAQAAWGSGVALSAVRSRIQDGRITEPLRINLGQGSFYQRLRESLTSDIAAGTGGDEGWTNAVLRHGTRTIPPTDGPHLPQLAAFGIDVNEILRTVGRRIGEEILLDSGTPSDEEDFRRRLERTWSELGMGRIEFEGEPLRSIRVHDSGSCGGEPDRGVPFCHLDEGILEGILQNRYGSRVRAIERECSSAGENHCHFDILLEGETIERGAAS